MLLNMASAATVIQDVKCVLHRTKMGKPKLSRRQMLISGAVGLGLIPIRRTFAQSVVLQK